MRQSINTAILATILGAVIFGFSPKEKFVPVVRKVMPSVTAIYVRGGIGNARVDIGGSGVFISTSGHILTCAHLFTIDRVDRIVIETVDGDLQEARLVLMNKRRDLALLKTVEPFVSRPVKIANPFHLRVGQEVFAVGSPLGLNFSVTTGVISALYRDFPFAYNVTQSDTALNPGNSGGPLFNLAGELVGINSFIVSPSVDVVFSGLGFSVQCGECLKFLTVAKTVDPSLIF